MRSAAALLVVVDTELPHGGLGIGGGSGIDAEEGRGEVGAQLGPYGQGLARCGSRQIGAELAGGLKACEPVFGESAQHDRVHCHRYLGSDRARGRGRFTHVLVGDRNSRLGLEERATGEHLEEHHARRVEVGASIHGLAPGLFGREVLCSTENRTRLRDRGGRVGDGSRDAEVHDLDLAGRGDHDVAGLDVAMHDARTVRVLEGGQDSFGDAGGLGDGQGTIADELAQQPTLDVLHDDEGHHRLAAGRIAHDLFAGVVDPHDCRVRHARGSLRFMAEPRAEDRVVREARLEQLDRDATTELGIGGHVHVRHAAAPDEGTDLVAPGDHACALCDLVHRPLGSHRHAVVLPDSVGGRGVLDSAGLARPLRCGFDRDRELVRSLRLQRAAQGHVRHPHLSARSESDRELLCRGRQGIRLSR